MATTTISWGDGSGDNIYLTYPSASGDQTVTVTSDANAGASSRSKNITFSVTAGQTTISRTLIVVQEAATSDLIIITRDDVYPTYNDTAVGYTPSQ